MLSSNQKEISEMSKLWKSFLGTKPVRLVCVLETEHGRRTTPTTKLFVSTRKLQQKQPEPPKIFKDSSPDEDVLCSSKTMHNRRKAQRKNYFGVNITGTKITDQKTEFESR
jgi:hypothetical protein